MTSEWPLIVHGDIEGACLDILKNATEIQALTLDGISSNLKDYRRGKKWIQVVREGGALPWPKKADKSRVDFMCFGNTRPEAHNIAQVAQAVLCRAMGAYVGFGVRLIDVKTETGVYRLPDKDTDSPRYMFSLRITCTPQ
jgi:hypothetical protein